MATTKEDAINILISQEGIDTNKISDGYHTFGELYEHRIQLFIALCRYNGKAWISRFHSDGKLAFGGGWFVIGIGKDPGTQITYHLPDHYWEQCSFAEVLNKAPRFDGHSSDDVLERLMKL